MASLTADQIKAANDAKACAKERPIPEWGGSVYIKSWTGRERTEFWKWIQDVKETKMPDIELWAVVCTKGLVSNTGEMIFNGDGVSILMDRNAPLVKQLADEILEYNGLDGGARERAEKNLTSSQSSDSGTESLAI